MLGRPGWLQRCSWKSSRQSFPLATLFDTAEGRVFSHYGLQPKTTQRSFSSATLASQLSNLNGCELSGQVPVQCHNGYSKDIKNFRPRATDRNTLSSAKYSIKHPLEAVIIDGAQSKRKLQRSRRQLKFISKHHSKSTVILGRRSWENWSARPNESKLRAIERLTAIRNEIASRGKWRVWELPDWHIKAHDPHEIVLYARSRHHRSALRSPVVKLEKFYKGWTNALNRLHHYFLIQGPSLRNDRMTWRFQFKNVVDKKQTLRMSSSHKATSIVTNRSYISSRITRRYWMSALLWALSYKPYFVHSILSVVNSRAFKIPSYIALDCVTFCLRRILPEPDMRASSKAVKYSFNLVMYYLDKYYAENGMVQVNGRLTRLLSSHLKPQMLLEFQNRLSKYDVHLSPYDIRNFAYRSLAECQVGKALAWIGRLSLEELNADETLTLCTMLLRSKWELENPYELRTNILYALLEIGVRPNGVLRDVIVLNAMEGGDRHSAWSSYRVMLDNGLAPSAYTYAILLKGAELGDGPEVTSSIYREIQDNGMLYRSPKLATVLLYAVYRCESQQEHTSPFNKCLEIYCKAFDLKPLQHILIAEGVKQSNPPGIKVMRPGAATLGIMVTAWLRENKSSAKLERSFKMYIRCVQERRSRLAITGHYTYVFQAFIKAYTELGHSLQKCVSIVRGMDDPKLWDIRRPSPSAYARNDLESDMVASLENHYWKASRSLPLTRGEFNRRDYYVEIPKPDVGIWSSLLYAYMKNGSDFGAEKIMEIMHSRDITPDAKTWNDLIHGYAALNNIDGVIGALQRRTNAKMQPDDWTLRALGRAKNREALREALKKLETTNTQGAEDETSWERMNQVLEEQYS